MPISFPEAFLFFVHFIFELRCWMRVASFNLQQNLPVLPIMNDLFFCRKLRAMQFRCRARRFRLMQRGRIVESHSFAIKYMRIILQIEQSSMGPGESIAQSTCHA